MSLNSNIRFTIKPGGTLNGRIRVPGDKSISHRSIMLGSIAEGVTKVTGFLEGADSLATLRAFRDMGVEIEGPENGSVTIHGVGMHGLQKPKHALDLGNSGTSMRLLTGLLAAQSFDSELCGDDSLSGRPMLRVTKPVSLMGGNIVTESDGTAPLKISGGQKLKALDYEMPMASAQVKSCVMLAGLYADGKTSITEPGVTRDHTERMLQGFGYDIRVDGNRVSLTGGGKLVATTIDVPSDISSAAFFLVGGSIANNSELTLKHVGMNPTRTGVIKILQLMGADISILNEKNVGGEPVADLVVRSSHLKGIHIPQELVPLAIDEFPVLFVAAACAEGETILTGAEELRVKESDRIQVMADGLQAIGVDATPTEDGMIIKQSAIKGGNVRSHGDHRISMAFAMAALKSKNEVVIEDCANVATSFPNFTNLCAELGLNIQVSSDEN